MKETYKNLTDEEHAQKIKNLNPVSAKELEELLFKVDDLQYVVMYKSNTEMPLANALEELQQKILDVLWEIKVLVAKHDARD